MPPRADPLRAFTGDLIPGERGEGLLGDVQFCVLQWDQGPEFWGAAVECGPDNCSSLNHWFCVRVLSRPDMKPLRIEKYDITISISGIPGDKIIVDKDEGWCHYNFAFQAQPGLQLVQIFSGGRVVAERVVLFTDARAEPWWNSRGKGAKGLPANEIAKAHLSQGAGKKSSGDLQKFRKWASENTWEMFGPKYNHYDWWMFPIHAAGRKPEFAVGTGEVMELRSNEDFMRNYREGVELMLLSWGWDLRRGTWCEPRHPRQGWRNWSVRLAKMATSLAIFGELYLFNHVRDFLYSLLAEERAGHPALTNDTDHKEPGGRIIIEEQFGVNPCDVLQIWE